MSSSAMPDCTITHYFADHHSKIFWDEKMDGREYGDDYITVLDLNAMTDKALNAIHKKSIPLKDRLFGHAYSTNGGLTAIIAAANSTMNDRLCRGYSLRRSDKSIVTHLYSYDIATIAEFNLAIERILSEMSITVDANSEIVQASPHLP